MRKKHFHEFRNGFRIPVIPVANGKTEALKVFEAVEKKSNGYQKFKKNTD